MARARETGIWMNTDRTISSRVRRRSPTKMSSTRSRRKLPRPTNWVGGPKPFQLKKLEYAATTIGVSTSRPKTSSAGVRNRTIVGQLRRRPRRRGVADSCGGWSGGASSPPGRSLVSTGSSALLGGVGDSLRDLFRRRLARQQLRHAVVDLLTHRGRVRLVQLQLEGGRRGERLSHQFEVGIRDGVLGGLDDRQHAGGLGLDTRV